jgi:hypothetical protein
MYLYIYHGMSVHYAESVEKVPENLERSSAYHLCWSSADLRKSLCEGEAEFGECRLGQGTHF